MNKYMLLAVEAAKDGMARGLGGPFGAVIVKNGEVVSIACNEVLASSRKFYAIILPIVTRRVGVLLEHGGNRDGAA